MFSRAAILLFLTYLIADVRSQESELPVDLLALKHIQINDYHGPLNAEMMTLFDNIETLELRTSNFTPLAQNFLHPLRNLKKLSISNCHSQRKVHDISSCCKNLREVEFINSGLPSVSWHIIGKWPLEKLYLHKEKVPKLEANILVDTKLKDLTIEYSNLESIDDGAFNKLEHLESLNLQNNKIKKITKEMLAHLKNVKVINLKGNLLEKLTTDLFPSLPNLEKINVGHNPIKEINLVGIKELAPKLIEVDISDVDESVDITKSGGVPFTKSAVL